MILLIYLGWCYRKGLHDIHVEILGDFNQDDVQLTEPIIIPKPVISFEECFSSEPDILEEIEKQGFTVPTPIQSQLWPVLLSGYDAVGIAQTGTGKTTILRFVIG
jgi:superfamily II DNA/RNA helicase